MSDNIKVVVKVRPLIARELEDKQQHQWRVNNNTLYQLDSNGRDNGQHFTFDKVYGENTKTLDVYNDVAKPIVEAAVAGFNGTIFAYGQTSSGKTYTMTGTDESPGIIPLAVLNLFEMIKKIPGRDFVVSVSYIELYNENLRDLLDLTKEVSIRQTLTVGIEVEATKNVTASPEEVLEAVKVGNANRQTAFTNMNESSSRSHSIFQISIESREHIEGEEQAGCVNVSQLNLVDLAGSERAGQTGATGLRFKEGTAINKSLTSLALVIKHLSENQIKYINFRDSKLTRILQNSLGGNAKTCIICAITPAALEETNSTLQFATRAKIIKNKPEVNAVATDATMIQKLTKELSMLKSTLESKKNLEVMLESKINVEQDLQKKIANLQRFILNGCSQRSNVELMGGVRRKLLPPRRITISTLHPIEEGVPKVPKFSTPSLKYNPSMIQNAAEFMPIDKLSSLPEEPPRLITPPPNERKVNFNDEVIEIDSDDDDCSKEGCSPYHECYNASKTPPCVLRKNAKQAEKNLKDLVELTDREKMYSPSVVELIEKLEQRTKTTAKLQDELEVLKSRSEEKDLEIEELRRKIHTTEQDKKTVKIELETQHKEFSTKLTDWEVNYDMLKNKYKLREQELLSLLEEQRIKQADVIGKIPLKGKDKEIIHFMDMSKDISLVNSDNEISIVGPDVDEVSERPNILIKDMQAQLASKDQIIKDLETDINAQKEQIQRLETSGHDLLSQVDSLKNKLSYFENENELLRSTVNELNCTIKSQKDNLKSAQNDIDSYNSVVQELQIKLTNKENLTDVHISESVLESMMINEDKTLANNENIKNVIHSLKLALDNSKKEVDLWKSKMQNNNESGDKDSGDKLKVKSEEVEMLNAEIAKFSKQANENLALIDSLLREKNERAHAEQELVKKLSEEQERINECNILCNEQALQIDNLKKDSIRLETTSAEKEQLNNTIETLLEQLDKATNTIIILEKDINNKNLEIKNLNTKNNEFQDCLNKAKMAVRKVQNVFTILTGDVRELPEMLDSVVNVYNALNVNLNILEDIATETISQKGLIQKSNIELKNEIAALVLQHESQISDAMKETENLNRSVQHLNNEIKELNDRNSGQLKEIETLKHELDGKKIELNNFEKQVKASQETNDVNDMSLKVNDNSCCEQITNQETETHNYVSPSKSQESKEKCEQEEGFTQQLNDLNNQLQQKCAELTNVKETLLANQESNDQLIENIIRKLSNIIDNIKEKNSSIKNCLMSESRNQSNNILPLLDAVGDHIIMQSPVELENKELKSKMEIISANNKSLECDLKLSSELLQQIQEELKISYAEIKAMEQKAIEWKKQFLDLDLTMKEEMKFLQSENEKLKVRIRDLHEETQINLQLLEETGKSTELLSRKSFIHSNAERVNIKVNCPRSLFKTCCDKIIEAVDEKRNENVSMIISKSSTNNKQPVLNRCVECDKLVLELSTIRQENINLTNLVEQLEIWNKNLSKEHRELSEEVYSLVELSQELEKKTVNHRTNLSILTATTYAENKSLNSQVKGLQHHHSRVHNVCQRDMPEFKKQLNQLMTILKDDSSFSDVINSGHKRYFLPNLLESTVTSNQTTNESALDGDLLMLDTNFTLTTADNTLVGYNQTCLDSTQNMFNETDCQAVDHNVPETNLLHNQIDILKCDNENLCAKLEKLTEENIRLQEQVTEYLDVKGSKVSDGQNNPTQISEIKDTEKEMILKELELLSEQLSVAIKQKQDIEQKYNDIVLEMPSTDALIHKMKTVEEDYKNKVKELTKTLDTLNAKNIELKALQDENDSLSTQVMENISEIDDLNKEVIELKEQKLALLDQCQAFEVEQKSMRCPKCEANDENGINNDSQSQLNRSLSDSDTTSRHNKICTLQSEIHAGREDCKVLTEDVVTIKHHLDQSNMSMDLDESLNFELANESISTSPQSKKCSMPDIQDQQPLELYMTDKNDCFKFYLEKTGIENKNPTSRMRIIEVMKLLYENVVTRHGNEVENLANKLKDYEESHAKLQVQINLMKADNLRIQKDLDGRDESLNFITKVVTQLKDHLSLTEIIYTNPDIPFEAYSNRTEILKSKFLATLDKHFNLSSVSVFEQIEGFTTKLIEEYTSTNETLTQMRQNLTEKDKEYNLLKAQNATIQEINNAVTLDIVRKEQENSNIIKETYQKLLELNLISPEKVQLCEPFNIHSLLRLLEHFINECENEKAKGQHSQEIEKLKETLSEKEKQLNELNEILKDVNNKKSEEISEKLDQIKKLEGELNFALNTKVEEDSKHVTMSQNLIDEISKLKDNINAKEKTIKSMYENEARVNELLNSVKNLHDSNEKLKAANDMISKEAKSYAVELEKSCATIKQNNIDIDKMTSDILVLREAMKEASAHVERLKQEVQTLSKENFEVKRNLEVKTRDCSRLEVNIKTHEKTAEVQSRMIIRLQKVKEDDDKEHSKLINELSEKYTVLQAECEELRNTIKILNEEIEQLKSAKQSLEHRLVEVEESGRRSRTSMDAVARRRQSLHDSKRLFEELEEHKNIEAVFGSKQITDDFFDDDLSGRSTPFGQGKGRDSLLSRTDHSDKDDELSRPSSVLAKAARRRRQSSHDLHRSVTPHAPSPSDLSNYVIDEMQQLKADTSRNRLHSDNEIAQLKAQLASCETELEELKEKYRELDEECETCAEYLRERDQQCMRLKKEKAALENQVMELKTKAATPDYSMAVNVKPTVAHVAVNTDEDWTNLHSVVVDRMSYDAEVEKNKRLTKTIEELRFTKMELKNTLAKMQKALEKNSAKDNSRELEQTRLQLKASNDELRELRKRYKDLDEECETCANYLKEREEQCRKLKEAKTALEAKLEELQQHSHKMEHSKLVRKKRQTVHDMNRPETSADQMDVTTETTNDFLSSQLARDDSMQPSNESLRDIDHYRKMVEILTQQKMHLELQLRTAQVTNPMFVATGSAIVQNQQITDVMKENQKLKKLNAKLVHICRKRGKSANRENEDPCEQG